MILKAKDLSRKFGSHWVIQNLSESFKSPDFIAITGANGSGKSTFLKLLIGILPPSKGKVIYELENQVLDADVIPKHISVSAPYMDLVEDFTLAETLEFHSKFKVYRQGYSNEKFLEETGLGSFYNRQLKFFSSGMKQRVKLGLCFFFRSDILFLDEPTTNLDEKGKAWYQENIVKNKDRLVLVFSNLPEEYKNASRVIRLG